MKEETYFKETLDTNNVVMVLMGLYLKAHILLSYSVTFPRRKAL
jgi:hypothetical protein